MSHTEIRQRDTLLLTARAWLASHMDSLYDCPQDETERVVKCDEFVLLLNANVGSENDICCFDAACFVLTVLLDLNPKVRQLNQLQFMLESATRPPVRREAELRRLYAQGVPIPVMGFIGALTEELRQHGASTVEASLVTNLALRNFGPKQLLTIEFIMDTVNQYKIELDAIDVLCEKLQAERRRFRLDQLLWQGVTE